MIPRLAYLPAAIGFLTVFSASASPVPGTPEERTLRAAQRLKPIDDEEWRRIAGDRIASRYDIVRGDTLSEISGRLFGDIKYWPKIWALNNDTIANPHLIRPGNSVQFEPGSSGSLPTVSIQGEAGATDAGPAMLPEGKSAAHPGRGKGRSGDWRKLPPQAWENALVFLPPEVDPDGFDRRSKIVKGHSDLIEAPAMVASERVEPLGFISASRTESRTISLNDTIYIEASSQLNPGETYAISKDPKRLAGPSGSGYAYPILGKVKILGQHADMFIGLVTEARDVIERESFLIPVPSPTQLQNPVAGPSDLEAVIMTSSTLPGHTLTQHRFAFVDRGTEDGIEPGMVFRAFQHHDPSNQGKITSDNFINFADFIVLQTSAELSLVVVLSSLSPVVDETTVHLLTNVDDVGSAKGFVGGPRLDESAPAKPEIPKLSPEEEKAETVDRASGEEKLTESQAEELKQLENLRDKKVPAPSPTTQPEEESLPELEAKPTGEEPAAEPPLPPFEESPSEPAAAPSDEQPPALEPVPETPPSPVPSPEGNSAETEELQGLTEE